MGGKKRIFNECFKSREKCYVFNSYSNNRCRLYEHYFWFGNFCQRKNKDIAILKTLGFPKIGILKIFFFIGLTIGSIGAVLGTFFGIIITENLKYIQIVLENLLETELFSEEVYFLSTLPSDIKYEEVFFVFFISLIITILSSIFPAIRASNIDPVNILKNE